MKKVLFFVIIFSALHLSHAFANNQPVLTPALQQAMQEKGDDEFIPVNIRFANQYDSKELLQTTSKMLHPEQRRKYVINELKTFSENEQAALLGFLDAHKNAGMVAEVKSFWLVNLVHCRIKPALVNELLNFSEIDQIDLSIEREVLPVEPEQENDESDSNDKTDNVSWNISLINAPEAWEEGYTGRNVIVAVLDTGVNYNHKDLEYNMWEHPDYPYHGYNTNNDNYNTMDGGGHGTHVAGTVAGTGYSGLKTGVAPDATIMIVKVLSSIGSGWEDRVWSGIEFAVENGAHVMNLSLSWRISWNPDFAVWRTLMDNAHAAGVIAAVAAGNSGSINTPLLEVGTPGNIPPPWLHPDQTLAGGISAVVAVGSTNYNDQLSSFSSKGPSSWQDIEPYFDYPYDPEMGLIRPDVVAPGSGIMSLAHDDISGYTIKSGTSMASPTAAGVMALILSKNPYLSLEQISQILEESAHPLSETKSNSFGSGRLNAHAAVLETPFLGVSSMEIDDSQGNADGKINPGERINLPMTLVNTTEETFPDVFVRLRTTSPYIQLIDSIVAVGNIPPGYQEDFSDVFSVQVSDTIPGEHQFHFVLEVIAENHHQPYWERYFSQKAYAPNLVIKGISFQKQDNDKSEDPLVPGGSLKAIIQVENTGQLPSESMMLSISGTEPFFDFANNTLIKDPIETGASRYFEFEMDIHPNVPVGMISGLKAQLYSGDYSKDRIFPIRIGLIAEDWESGDFQHFDWQFAGNADWYLVENESVSGTYSARSGVITHNEHSELLLEYHVLTNDSISFYRKVSSENNRDWLEFYIDDQLIERWSGSQDWKRFSYPVESGQQTFRWVYRKDPTVSIGQDCGWIDMIQLPVAIQSSVIAGFDLSSCGYAPVELSGFATAYDQTLWTTNGDGAFSDPGSLDALYYPGPNDTDSGQAMLTLEVTTENDTTLSDALLVFFLPQPHVDLGADTTLCANHHIVLDAGPGHAGILWPDGSTEQTLTVTADMFGMEAQVWVKVTNPEGCWASDTIQLTFDPCLSADPVEAHGAGVVIYPNPAADHIMIDLPAGSAFPATVSLYNNSGLMVFSERYLQETGLTRINLPNMKPGVYFLHIDTQGYSVVKKVIKL